MANESPQSPESPKSPEHPQDLPAGLYRTSGRLIITIQPLKDGKVVFSIEPKPKNG